MQGLKLVGVSPPSLDTEPDLDPRSAQDSPGGLPKTGNQALDVGMMFCSHVMGS